MGGFDTIYAYSSGDSVSGIGVLRISGPACQIVVRSMLRKVLEPRRAHFVNFLNPVSGDVIDQGIALFFPGPHSASGEDCVEMHTHGSRAVRLAMYAALSVIDGCRLAEQGEFTKRAFVNGKMDLTGVEGLGDLLSAQTERQRQQAVATVSGALAKRAYRWRSEIVGCLALVEAFVDFADEGDAPDDFFEEVGRRCSSVIKDMRQALGSSRAAEIVRSGFHVAICGRPNSGKSSLLNWFARRDVAIVSEIAGTTRDVIEVSLDFEGWLVVLQDTAGIRATTDVVESKGIGRALDAAGHSDLILWLSDSTDSLEIDSGISDNGVEVLLVLTKCDLVAGDNFCSGDIVSISVKDEIGLEQLRDAILARITAAGDCREDVLLTRARHLQLVGQCIARLNDVLVAKADDAVEIIAEDLRRAAFHIGCLTGSVGVEDVLDDIFQRFCIGK